MASSASAIEINDLWFSYEVSESISSTVAKSITRTCDGGCSIDMPRAQHPEGTQAAYKLQLKAVNMSLPAGARCILIGHNGAGKSTLMSVAGGKHMVKPEEARVLGRPAFHDTTLASEVALLTGNWTHTVSFVGHNVPYQAMEVSRLIASHSAGVDPERVRRLVELLEVNEKWNLTTVSDGQRRRVQILCKLLKPSSVLLLDEITTDLDLLARQDLLAFLREESEQRGVCIVYCTHIFDGLDGWPTHVAYLSDGETKICATVAEAAAVMPVPAEKRSRGWGDLFCSVQQLLLERATHFEAMLVGGAKGPVHVPTPSAGPAIKVSGLTWGYPGSAPVLKDLNLELARGERCLLIGANGAGKTTLLKLLGGKHMLPRGAVSVLGHAAFHDTCLNTLVSMLSGDWTRQVACVGNGVPFQADFSVGFMAKSLSEALVRDGMDAGLVAQRLARLSELLDLNFEWRLHKVSDGQRRRAQLLLKLLRPSELLLLDEVTTDLDVLSRQALLAFLREESEQRGTTVIYSTHIFDGLDDWPTQLIHMREGTVVFNGAPSLAPRVAAGTSGSLFGTVRGWLTGEREVRQAQALNAVPSCPTTSALLEPAAPPPVKVAPPTSFASKFDRFGGASRQRAYF